jgi:hypothetical protein
MIAKRAQERILLKSRAQRLRIKRPDAPPQPRVPTTTTTTTTAAAPNATTPRNARIPRDEQRAAPIPRFKKKQLDGLDII